MVNFRFRNRANCEISIGPVNLSCSSDSIIKFLHIILRQRSKIKTKRLTKCFRSNTNVCNPYLSAQDANHSPE